MSSHSKKWCTPGDYISIWYDYCLSVFSFKAMEKGKIYDTLETKTDYKECCRWIRTKYLLKIFQHFSGGLKAVLKTGSMICIARSLLTVLYMETWTAAMWMKFFSWFDWAVCLTGFCWYRQTTMMCSSFILNLISFPGDLTRRRRFKDVWSEAELRGWSHPTRRGAWSVSSCVRGRNRLLKRK